MRWQQELAEDRSGRFLYVRDARERRRVVAGAGAVLSALRPLRLPPRPRLHRLRMRGAGDRLGVDALRRRRARRRILAGAPLRTLGRGAGACSSPASSSGTAASHRRRDGSSRSSFSRPASTSPASPCSPPLTCGTWARRAGGTGTPPFPTGSAFAAAEPVARRHRRQGGLPRPCGSSWATPAALVGANCAARFGRHDDPIAALACELEIGPGAACGRSASCSRPPPRPRRPRRAPTRPPRPAAMDAGLETARAGWRERLAEHRIETPEPTLDWLANDWLRYQAISARLWGRAGYYQQSGAYGFRDQLQDSQVWLTIDPAAAASRCGCTRRHQFAGRLGLHWWHPLTEQGHVTKHDRRPALARLRGRELRQGDRRRLEFLADADAVPRRPEAGTAPRTRRSAPSRASSARTSPRGLPYIGAGDWNDGLSALGLEERGESVWLGAVPGRPLADWAEIYRRRGEPRTRRRFRCAARCDWSRRSTSTPGTAPGTRRATLDDGRWIGSGENRDGQIFLNAQTWAILNDVAPPERARRLPGVGARAPRDAMSGALLLAPGLRRARRAIGYITRYAPGLRENGGVYTHAATWAIAAAAKTRDAELVGQLLGAINPALKDPRALLGRALRAAGQRRRTRLAATTAAAAGPGTPARRRGSTASSRSGCSACGPTGTACCFDPCLPPGWHGARMMRPWRGATARNRHHPR